MFQQKRIKNQYSTIAAILLFLFLLYGLGYTRDLSDQEKQKKIQEMYAEYKAKDFPYVPDITVEAFQKLKKTNKVILVDVRSEKEQKVSMIPSAITAKEFEKDAERYKDYIIVVYCTIGYRSGKYVKKLRKKGFNAFNLIGGVLSWAHAGQKFSSPVGDSLKVHVYGKKWNLVPEGYKAVW